MVNVLSAYSWSQSVFAKGFPSGSGSDDIRKICGKSTNWSVDVIFECADGISIFPFRNSGYKNYKELQSMGNFYNKFQDSWVPCGFDNIKYKFCESYTWSNFMKHQSIWQWALLPVLLSPFGVKQLAQYYYPDLSAEEMEKMSREHAAQEEVNAFVRDKFESTKDEVYLSLLSTKFPKVDELTKNNTANRENIYIYCYFVPGLLTGLVGGVVSIEMIDHILRRDENKEWDKYSRTYRLCRFFVPACGVLFTYCAVSLSTIAFGSYISDAIERPAFGMACVTGCYAVVVSLWNIIKMRTVREEPVKISEIPQLLKRTDIEIV